MDPLRECVRELAVAWRTSYALENDSSWWHFEPVTARPFPVQGWKIHVSAVPVNVLRAVRSVAGIVLPRGLRWKVARSVQQYREMCAPGSPLTQVGKLVTVYTEGDVADLAAELHEATKFLAGPVVPSDRRFCRGSNVYLRYGAFTGMSGYAGPAQTRQFYLVDPECRRVEDRRAPGEVAPSWVEDVPVEAARRRGSGLFGRGIVVREALRQSAKGGVYRAELDGMPVVVKEARFGTTADLIGRDARTRLHNEWRLLGVLKGTGLAPEPVEFFVEEDNAYLVEEFLPGTTLRELVERMNYRGEPGRDAVCDRIRELVARVRHHGVRIRDLTPNNIMVAGDRCVLIDLELSDLEGAAEPPFDGWTPGYAGDVEDALAATVHFVQTGVDPVLDETTAFRSRGGEVSAGQVLEEAVGAGTELVRRVEWDAGPWPWPGSWSPGSMHPASFMAGTTGIAQYYLDLWRATNDGEWLRHARELLEWTYDVTPFIPGHTPPGLYFGIGALPWLMADFDRRAIGLVAALAESDVDSPDVTHGQAGIGLAALAVWHRTGDVACRAAADRIAEGLIRDARDRDGLPVWPQRDRAYYGFGHGSAGIGYFLLAAGHEELAVRIGHALLGEALPVADGEGLSWPHHTGSADDTPWTHWCNGAAGVGAFLLALESATGYALFGAAAEKAGRAISRGRPFGSCCRCHGLAGDGDYLLQLAVRREEFRPAAEHIGGRLDALRIQRGYAVTWPHEGDGRPRPGYMRGYTGVHAFRLRLAGLVSGTPLMLTGEEAP